MSSSTLTQEVQDELLSVSMIYLDIASIESDNILVVKPNESIRIRFILSSNYPEFELPVIEVSAPELSSKIKLDIKNNLENYANNNKGNLILYDLVTKLKEYVDNLDAHTSSTTSTTKSENNNEKFKNKIENFDIKIPEIYGTGILRDRKSIFQAHIGKINSKDEAMVMLKYLMTNSKIARATHRIYAYRTYVIKNDKKVLLHDCEDDGEHGAGSKVLNLLELMDCQNVMVIVTRWYGGIHLGPDRFKHILNMARKAIIESGFVDNQKVKTAKQASSKS